MNIIKTISFLTFAAVLAQGDFSSSSSSMSSKRECKDGICKDISVCKINGKEVPCEELNRDGAAVPSIPQLPSIPAVAVPSLTWNPKPLKPFKPFKPFASVSSAASASVGGGADAWTGNWGSFGGFGNRKK